MKNEKRNQKFILVGMSGEDRRSFSRQLQQLGRSEVKTIAAADLVVIGRWARPELLEECRCEQKWTITQEELADRLATRAERLEVEKEPVRSVLERDGDTVRIFGRPVPSRSGIEPGPSPMICGDRPTLLILQALATGMELGMPVRIEGPTGTAKSLACSVLAGWLGLPVHRFNFSTQTELGDLVGKFIPAAPKGREFFKFLEENRQGLSGLSVAVLEKAHAEHRELTGAEMDFILNREGVDTKGWQWTDGCLVRALRQGGLFCLDELNLASSAVLERLNPLLENPPTFTLWEHQAECFGHGGTPVATPFQIVATMNSVAYAGRQALSPALLARFPVSIHSEVASEQDTCALADYLATGLQPTVLMPCGRRFKLDDGEAPMPGLSRLGQSLLHSIALYHTQASAVLGDGASADTPSRRTLVECLRAVHVDLQQGQEAEAAIASRMRTFYLNRAAEVHTRSALRQLAKSLGLPALRAA